MDWCGWGARVGGVSEGWDLRQVEVRSPGINRPCDGRSVARVCAGA